MLANPAQAPMHRKPVPKPSQQTPASYAQSQPPSQIQTHPPYGSTERGHSRTRTGSSNVLPSSHSASGPPPPVPGRADQQYAPTRTMQSQHQPTHPGQFTRRTPSNATSNSSTSTNTNLQRIPTNPGSVRRSTSSRSNSTTSPTSYVALMRKQKATVWCDRAQHDDPRLLQAQRQAKMRAAMEVAGGHHVGNGRVSTSSQGIAGGVRSKIRHHGAPKASAYSGTHLISAAGVPMRLSATEVDEGDSDEEKEGHGASKYHVRNGSGRSSVGSGGGGGGRNNSYLASHQQQYGQQRRPSNGPSPTSGQSPQDSMGDLAEEETPTPNSYGKNDDYFQQAGGQGGSGSSSEREERGFGNVGGLPIRQGGYAQVEKDRKTSEELRRRGSVDDRTMTMSAGRLFVANPDLSD